MNTVWKIARKEFTGFFASPAAWLFLGAFLFANLFIFFWAETFFARNLADLKPLFEWMPVLLIFLVGALSMRTWAEERRSGTLENLLTSPVRSWQLVGGKFLANLGLVALALLLTFPLPVTVAQMGPMDWGPVIGGYVASLFLAAAYLSMGLYMSARTDNGIVALILTVACAGAFYLIGSPVITGLFGHEVSGVLKLIGSGARFDSITRGVLDLRDLVYYLSLVGIFLTLNRFTLERLRWTGNPPSGWHRRWRIAVGLVIANLVVVNFWLHRVGWARADLTENNIYSLSPVTDNYLDQASEPLLIRGYFSSKTHPLLEPLVPRLKDLLKEYRVAGGEKVRVDFLDPHTDQSIAEEAAEQYGVRPVPFRMASRYEAGVVNSYFDLVISYGNQHEVLGFDALIEVKGGATDAPEVRLKNPEYAITSAIRKVISGYRGGGDVFSGIGGPVRFNGYVSAKSELPPALTDFRSQLDAVLAELKETSGGKLETRFADPGADPELAERLKREFGFTPQVASLFDSQPFWFYMTLRRGEDTVQVPLPDEFTKEALRRSIESAASRLTSGVLRTVALVKPDAPNRSRNPMMPQRQSGGRQYQELRAVLEESYQVTNADLSDGRVPGNADLLLLLAPENLGEKALFAVDQFLMRGGTVVMATAPYDVTLGRGLRGSSLTSGLEDWLKSHGITLPERLVLDPRNASLPIPEQRNLGGVPVTEVRMAPYPFFPDIRNRGLDADHPVTAGLKQLTLNWATPVNLDPEKAENLRFRRIAQTSERSWTTAASGPPGSVELIPDYNRYPEYGFAVGNDQGRRTLAVAAEGRFTSYFEGRDSPLLESGDAEGTEGTSESGRAPDGGIGESESEPAIGGVIERSPESSRLVLVSSNAFASDSVTSLISRGQGSLYTAQLEFLRNSVDWALGDEALLEIRGGARFARILEPMDRPTQRFWEYLNYGLALFGLLFVWGWRRWHRARRRAHYDAILQQVRET